MEGHHQEHFKLKVPGVMLAMPKLAVFVWLGQIGSTGPTQLPSLGGHKCMAQTCGKSFSSKTLGQRKLPSFVLKLDLWLFILYMVDIPLQT